MTHAEILSGIVQYAQTGADVVRILGENGLIIVPKQVPEETICAFALDAEDTDAYEVVTNHCAVKL